MKTHGNLYILEISMYNTRVNWGGEDGVFILAGGYTHTGS